MKKIIFLFVMVATFLLPSMANACQGTVNALNSAEVNEMKLEASSNCNTGDTFTIHNLETGQSTRVRVVNE